MVAHTCHPIYVGNLNRKVMVQAYLGLDTRPYLRDNKMKKNCGCESSARAPVWQVQVPEFKPQHCKKKGRKKRRCSLHYVIKVLTFTTFQRLL
jgi:hypothetical protein